MREMFGQSDTEKNISFSKCATAAPLCPRHAAPHPAAPRRHFCCAPAPLECSFSWEAQHLGWRTHMHMHARTCTHAQNVREREEGERQR